MSWVRRGWPGPRSCGPDHTGHASGLAVPLAKQGHPIPFRFPQYPPTIFDNLTSIVLERQGLFRLFPDFYGFSAEIEVYPSWCARAACGGCAVACGLRRPSGRGGRPRCLWRPRGLCWLWRGLRRCGGRGLRRLRRAWPASALAQPAAAVPCGGRGCTLYLGRFFVRPTFQG